jgi:hypothetical protein
MAEYFNYKVSTFNTLRAEESAQRSKLSSIKALCKSV